MQHLDTIKFRFPVIYTSYCSKDYNAHEYFVRGKNRKGNPIHTYQYKNHPGLFPGIRYIKLDSNTGDCIVQLSAKILRGRYPEKINPHTFRPALTHLNDSGLLRFEVDAVAEQALLLAAHAAEDVALAEPTPRYAHLLKLLHVNNDYILRDYNDFHSIAFEKDRTSRPAREYFKMYDKELEFEARSNKSFRETLSYGELVHLRQQFQGKTRFEINLNCLEKLRQYYELEPGEVPTVMNILQRDSNPVLSVYTAITKEFSGTLSDSTLATHPVGVEQAPSGQKRLFLDTLREKEQFDLWYLENSDYDLDKARYILKQQYSRLATVTARMKRLKAIWLKWQVWKENILGTDIQLLQEIRNKLHTATTTQPVAMPTLVNSFSDLLASGSPG